MASPDKPTDLPEFTNDTTCFSFGCKNIRDCILFLVDLRDEMRTYFCTFASEENRWTSDGKKGVFPLVLIGKIKNKCNQL